MEVDTCNNKGIPYRHALANPHPACQSGRSPDTIPAHATHNRIPHCHRKFPMKANDVKPGNALEMDSQLFIVRNTEHVKPGKGPAYVQAKLKNVGSGAVSEKRFRASEDVNVVNLDRREMEYLYTDASGHIFMDQETFDQTTISKDFLDEEMLYLKPNTVITVLMHNNKPITVELPAVVELQVTETAPQVKGATATNQLKEAELETGLKTRVPPFIENGEMIRISTEDASYMSRV